MKLSDCLKGGNTGKAARDFWGERFVESFTKNIVPLIPRPSEMGPFIMFLVSVVIVIGLFILCATGPFALVGWVIITVWDLFQPFPKEVVGYWAHAGWGLIFVITIGLIKYLISRE